MILLSTEDFDLRFRRLFSSNSEVICSLELLKEAVETNDTSNLTKIFKWHRLKNIPALQNCMEGHLVSHGSDILVLARIHESDYLLFAIDTHDAIFKQYKYDNKVPDSMNYKKIKDAQQDTLVLELNKLLAEELQDAFAYWSVVPFMSGEDRAHIVEVFKANADDEFNDHANKLINRIRELQSPLSVVTLSSCASFASHPENPVELSVEAQLIAKYNAEVNAITHYQKVIPIAYSVGDLVTADILKAILADEEQHLTEIDKFIDDLGIKEKLATQILNNVTNVIQ